MTSTIVRASKRRGLGARESWPFFAALVGCAAIAGLEEHELGPKKNVGGRAGSSAGNTVGSGGSTDAGAAGDGARGGDDHGGGNGGTSNGGGSLGGEGAGDGGSAGSVPDTTVHGRVMDHWFSPISGISVRIGAASAVTNARGEFTIVDVGPEYDASFTINVGGINPWRYDWRYEGLTRRDPTLQVLTGRSLVEGLVDISVPIVSLASGPRRLDLAISGPDTMWSMSNLFSQTLPGRFPVPWDGSPASGQAANYESLLWDVGETFLPIGYASYDSGPITLDAITPASISLNMPDEPIESGYVSGIVEGLDASFVTNAVFVCFPSGGRIAVVNDAPTSASFEYLVPSLPAASILVTTSSVSGSGGFSTAYRRSLSAGTSDVVLTHPIPPELISPADEASGVDGETEFRWTTSETERVYLLQISGEERPTRSIHVVTARARTSLGTAGELALAPENGYSWTIKAIEDVSNTDEAAVPGGFLFSLGDSTRAPPEVPVSGSSAAAEPRRLWTSAEAPPTLEKHRR